MRCSLTNDEQRQWYIGVDATGFGVPPLPFFDERATAHPLASLLQPVLLGNEPPGIRRIYVGARRWPTESPFAPTYERLRSDRVHDCEQAAAQLTGIGHGPIACGIRSI